MAAIHNRKPGVCEGCGNSVADRAIYCSSEVVCVALCVDCHAQLPDFAGPRCEHEPDSPLGACAWCAESWIEAYSLFAQKSRAKEQPRHDRVT
jgi:hypothetical protein